MRLRIAIVPAMAVALTAAPARAGAPQGGGARRAELNFDLARVRFHKGDHSIVVESNASWGDDTDRVVVKLDAGGEVGRRIDSIDAQLLWSHAIGSDVALLGGVRHEFRPSPHVTYAVVGVEGAPLPGLAAEVYAFLSEQGDLTGEIKAVQEWEVVPRLTVQPLAALAFAAQDVPVQGLGAGLTETEFALRVRYELAKPFAPYIGVSHTRLLGKTRRIALDAGDTVAVTDFVIGFSARF